MAKTADALVAVALSQVGYDRYEDPEQGTKYGRWYAELTHSPWFGTNGVPFCAMGASWSLYQLDIKCLGTPTASCTSGLLNSARRAGKLLRYSELERGDLILFNWSGAGYYASEADHVGIVQRNDASSILTVEFNVDGGKVLERTRYPWQVVGGIRPDFEKQEDEVYGFALIKKGSTGNEVKLAQAALNIRDRAGLLVDGEFGSITEDAVKAYQKKKGIYPDGMVGAKTWPALLGA